MLPLFRSEGQGRLLARLYLEPDRPAPIRELARELDLDAGGLTREANRLERAGLISSRRIGRQRLLRPRTESIYYPELYALLLKAFGPATVIGPVLREIEGIERALLFGSWAARYRGELGNEPGDIDLLIIGHPKRQPVARATKELSGRLGREVNATIITPERWRAGDSGFVRQVVRGPWCEVRLDRESAHG